MKKNKYLKNFKKNFVLVLPRTVLLAGLTFLICAFWIITLEFLRTIKDPLAGTLSTIIFLFCFLRILFHLDLGNMFVRVGTDWYDAMAYGTIENKVNVITREQLRKEIVDEIIQEHNKKKAHKKWQTLKNYGGRNDE